jgi:hypothetical protein
VHDGVVFHPTDTLPTCADAGGSCNLGHRQDMRHGRRDVLPAVMAGSTPRPRSYPKSTSTGALSLGTGALGRKLPNLGNE